MSDDPAFDAIVEGLDLDEPDEVVDYSRLSDFELSRAYSKIRQELLSLGEMTHLPGNPVTDKGRELHSRRLAMVVELRKRNLIA